MISVRLDAAGKPPIIVSAERSWFCFGPSNKFLKTHWAGSCQTSWITAE